MAKSIKEAMRAAQKRQLLEASGLAATEPLPPNGAADDRSPLVKLIKAANPKGKGGQQPVQVTYGPSSGKRSNKQHKGRNHRAAGIVFPTLASPAPAPVLPRSVAIPKPPARPNEAKAPPRLQVSATAALALTSCFRRLPTLLGRYELLGRAVRVTSRTRADEREVVLGLDFGTSCAKVVFGDQVLAKSFACRFGDGEGIESYLLPSAVFQTGDAFSLEAGTRAYRDLKLSLLSNPDDVALHVRAVAFMALAIRRARGWLLTEHAAVYKNTRIHWRLTVGLPAAQHLRSPFTHLFTRLASAAWAVSIADVSVTEPLITETLAADPTGERGVDVEVIVVPEIAAQIYGFVVSTSFDRHAPNLYLMADVGAGTVDSSLFRVKPAKGGRWDFEFYTSLVEPNGASNLHRYRCRWWADELGAIGSTERLRNALEDARMQTDIGLRVPEAFAEYFTGIKIGPFNGRRTPDGDFFERVAVQVQGQTFWRAWKNELLPKGNLTGVPFFLCGGAARMAFYQRLEPELESIKGCSWLKAEPWSLGVPGDLEAPGILDEDYDRLSVAYGLSQLEVGKIVQALPMAKLDSVQSSTWQENYVGKDMC